MNAQYKSSVMHQRNLDSGLTVKEHRELGEGDGSVSLIRYSDGSTWYFDNASGKKLHEVFGYHEANHTLESAWFLSRDRAVEFDQHCGGEFGAPETVYADDINLADILL